MSQTDPVNAPATPVLRVSPWSRRFWAWTIDSIVLGIVPTLITFNRVFSEMQAAGMLDPDSLEGDPAQLQEQMNEIILSMSDQFLFIGFVFAMLAFVYYVVLHGTIGKSLGKMALGIRVVKQDGTPCDFAAAGKRAVVHPLASSVPTLGTLVLLLNGLWPLWDEKRQSLGDKLGGTYVVRDRPEPQPAVPAV